MRERILRVAREASGDRNVGFTRRTPTPYLLYLAGAHHALVSALLAER